MWCGWLDGLCEEIKAFELFGTGRSDMVLVVVTDEDRVDTVKRWLARLVRVCGRAGGNQQKKQQQVNHVPAIFHLAADTVQ